MDFKPTYAYQEKVVLPYMEIERLSDDIVRFTLTRDAVINMKKAEEMTAICRKLFKDRVYKSLKIVPYKMKLEEDVLEYLASPARRDMISMEAVVVNTASLKLLGNFYLKIKRPAIKTRIFDSEAEALKWLNENPK